MISKMKKVGFCRLLSALLVFLLNKAEKIYSVVVLWFYFLG